MFRKKTFRVLTLLILAAIVLGLVVVQTDITDYERYWDLVKSAEPAAEDPQEDILEARQWRENVTKDIWFTRNSQRLHIRVHSDQSVLRFLQKNDAVEVVEDMRDVQATIQEDLYYLLPDRQEASLQPNGRLLIRGADPKDPSSWLDEDDPTLEPMQQLRYFVADTAQYSYSDNYFTADEVQTQRFYARGHGLDYDPEDIRVIMKGTAKALEFGIADEDIQFRARQLRATLYSDRGLF